MSIPVSVSISSAVQSAVRPVLSFAAILGARALPNTVAPMRSISGFFVRMMSAAKEAMAASFSGGQSSMTIT